MTQLTSPLKDSRNLWLFTAVWFVINVLQAIFTELAHDEAYYWMYARKLDIGYFDHPPMIAAMIRAGGFLFTGELGVRLLVVLFSTMTIPVLFSLCGKKDLWLFILIFCASTVFQVYGFIAVPDAPLLFFTALFFACYRNYTNADTVRNALFMAACIALLLYSKYHGILVVFFTVISDLKLFRRKSFYLVTAISFLMYLPHVLWQISHDYPSYQYHVSNKSQSAYNPIDSLEFLGATLMVAGPLIGLLLVMGFWKNRRTDRTLRAMRFTFLGFVIFFFLSTFNSAIEANWMSVSVVPLVVVAHDFIREHVTLRKWTIRLAFVSIGLFSFARINLATDLVPQLGSRILPEFYGWKQWTELVREHAQGCPVVIMNSYQRASKYSFYANTEALSLNNIGYRRNQFDLWDISDHMEGKRVALFRPWAEGRDSLETFETPNGKMQLIMLDNFHSYTKVRIATDKDWYTFQHSSDVEIPLTFQLPGDLFNIAQAEPVELVCVRYHFNDWDEEVPLLRLDTFDIPQGWQTTVHLHTPEEPGPYYLRFCLRSGWMPPYINSHLIRMDVE